MKFKISGEIEAKNEEEARHKATIEGGNDILEFEEITGKCDVCGKREGIKSVQISGVAGEVEKEIVVCEECLINLNFREYK